jgi:small subunit ribosomal protein S19e
MTTLYDVPADELIEAVAEELADEDAIEAPDWTNYATTGVDRELPPEQEDFWERRAASLFRKVAVDGPVGVGSLATAYGNTKGGSNRYQVRPPQQSDASRKIIRVALQQLEEAGYVKAQEGQGRVVTGDGLAFLDDVADEVMAELDDPELQRYA